MGSLLFLAACCTVATRVANKHPIRKADFGLETEQETEELERPPSVPPSQLEFKESPFCLHGCPAHLEPAENTVLERQGWVLSNDPQTKFADWAAYRITKGTIGKSKRRDWEADPQLPPEETLEPDDFRGAHAKLHTDRGHQVPLASFASTQPYEALNYLSNLTPQRSELNQQLWNRLEQAERHLVLKGGVAELYVVTGPLYEKPMDELPGADEPHTVPSGYFKVIAIENPNGALSTASIIVSQDTPGTDSHCDHRVSIDEIEERTGLDFFPGLSSSAQSKYERALGALFSRLKCR